MKLDGPGWPLQKLVHVDVMYAAQKMQINEVDARALADELSSGRSYDLQKVRDLPDEVLDVLIAQVYAETIRIDDIIGEEIHEEARRRELGFTSDDPCPECGERGACAYDSEGRPMIHTTDIDLSEGD